MLNQTEERLFINQKIELEKIKMLVLWHTSLISEHSGSIQVHLSELKLLDSIH